VAGSEFPSVEFERYADDAVVHCVSERQPICSGALVDRMEEVGLRLHPDKTKSFTVRTERGVVRTSTPRSRFLGTRSGSAERGQSGRMFLSFSPAISKDALKKISAEVRGWRLHHRVNLTFKELAKVINPIVAGWMHYYGRFYRSMLYPSWTHQCLSGALDPQQVQTVTGAKKARQCWEGSPWGIPACSRMEMDSLRLVIKMTRAV